MAVPFLFSGFLLGMQAAGLVLDYTAMKSNLSLIRKGRELENAQFNSNMEAIQLESAQASLNQMQDLRANVATQIAQNAARGISSGSMLGYGKINKSEHNFNEDERTRRLNLLTKEASLRATNVLSGLHTLQSETQLGQQFFSNALNTIPLASLTSPFLNTKTGKKAGYGLTEAS